jgi:ubiquinone/menaquinone biosynthesis C-methylase UbiE
VAIHPSAQGFHTAAGDYERARPDYPDEAARWLAERLDLRPGRTVLDIAAGTGKLTRALVASGAKVIAVEPMAGMRERLAAALPDVTLLDGVAEELGLEDGGVDAATVGQAFHWFDGDRSLIEIHRVVRAGGRLAVVYNRRQLDHPLQASLDAILRPLRGQVPAHRRGRWRDAFANTRLWTAVEEAEHPHVQLLDREGVVARVASTSFIAELPSDRRAEVLNQVRALVKERAEPIELPYVCELFAWQRLP